LHKGLRHRNGSGNSRVNSMVIEADPRRDDLAGQMV
jgi:hypothetical protein